MLLAILFAAFSATAQTSRKPTSSSKKKTTPLAATKRPAASGRSSHSRVAATAPARHGRNVREEASGGSARSGTRRVVVTRRMVHGHWVRTTQIVRAAPSGPSYQTHPDQERYQQIQQALASAGYFKGEANGQWGDDSVAALKQFQTEHKLVNDGKISSLSLIGLGLGPTREVAAKPVADSIPAPAAPAVPAEPTRN